jgi:predicted DNA-binding transcriptional regulator YafY
MFKWAVQYGEHAVILEPETLQDRVYSALKKAVRIYEEKRQ